MMFKASQETMKFNRFEKKKENSVIVKKNLDLNEATQGDK